MKNEYEWKINWESKLEGTCKANESEVLEKRIEKMLRTNNNNL